MKSSYTTNNYGKTIGSLVSLYQPKKIVEFGILEGYSLQAITENAPPEAEIVAYDIFEDFPYHHAEQASLIDRFGSVIKYGDFYKKHTDYIDGSIDFLHIDIANDGDVFKFFFEEWLPKLNVRSGIALLEGGSQERDNYDWMRKYNKKRISPALRFYSGICNILVLEPFPSLTLVTRR